MTTVSQTAPAAEVIDRLRRLAALTLGPHGNGDHVVDEVLDRDAREVDRHHWDGRITREEWLFTLTVRRCRAWLSGYAPSATWARARAAEHNWAIPGHVIDPVQLREHLASPAAVSAALADLTDPDRVAIVLCDALGMPAEECGLVCRTPPEVTTLHLRRGRKTLLELLGVPHATDPSAGAACDADHEAAFDATDAAGPGEQDATRCAAYRQTRAAVVDLRSALARHAADPVGTPAA